MTQYWLLKSEPSCFNIDMLEKSPKKTTFWDGVRNYQARNMLRDQMQVGDQAFFYHSNCEQIGIAGIVEIVKAGYPDHTAWNIHSDHYDSKSSPTNPIWYMVDVKFVKKFKKIITLDALKNTPALKDMVVARKGNRLSITPVTAAEWKIVLVLNPI